MALRVYLREARGVIIEAFWARRTPTHSGVKNVPRMCPVLVRSFNDLPVKTIEFGAETYTFVQNVQLSSNTLQTNAGVRVDSSGLRLFIVTALTKPRFPIP